MSRRVVFRESGEEGMLYDPERDELHVLNATARLVHRLASEGKSVEEIAEALRASFAIPSGTDLRVEIAACLAALAERGL